MFGTARRHVHIRLGQVPVHVALLLAVVLPVLAPAVACGQMYEDRMEPVDLGIIGVDTLRSPSSAYVGVDTCRTCHPTAYRAWLGSKHARSTVGLMTDRAVVVADREGMAAGDPAKGGKCLKCHGVAHDVAAAYRDPGLRIAEGVTCEGCHGPQGDHVMVVATRGGRLLSAARTAATRAFRSAWLEWGGEGTMARFVDSQCMRCHESRPSHEMERHPPVFVYKAYWNQISHGPE